MKTTSQQTARSGVALVTVLMVLVVLVILVVALAQIAGTERRSSGLSATIISNESLLEQTTNLALAQLRAATAHEPGTTWASQPGMIRVIGGNNALRRAYKLYSSQNMMLSTEAQLTSDLDIEADPPNWSGRPAIWHDLNAPAIANDGTASFPIIDPSALGRVAGFSVDGSTAPREEIPMPVQWLYVLQNGDVVAPDPSEGNGTLIGLPGASADNPPVGRIAFWADDETSKVNVNTAGYARNDDTYSTFWDTPRIRTNFEDTQLSLNQPWTHEYQRYPGHPATTGLNVVFEEENGLTLSEVQTLALTPYYQSGGTLGGNLWGDGFDYRNQVPTIQQVQDLLKSERLYTSIDELLLNPARTLNPAGLNPDDVEIRRFFLTATSRAPETNLFDMPRVTIWPVWSDPILRTGIDNLIAFCSTIGPAGAGEQRYYFVRENYLNTNELQGIPQNMRVFNYLRSLTAESIPSFGSGTFAEKYSGTTRTQILTSIFDTIRAANLRDKLPGATEFSEGNSGYVSPTYGPDGTVGPGRAPTLTEVALLFTRPPIDPEENQPVPEDPDNPGHSHDGVRLQDYVKCTIAFKLETPAVGMSMPGQNVRIEVSGLSGFMVRADDEEDTPWQPMFDSDTFSNAHRDRGRTTFFRRGFGHWALWSIGLHASQYYPSQDEWRLEAFVPPGNDLILPWDGEEDRSRTFAFQGSTLDISIYSPADAPEPFQTYRMTFPNADFLTPRPIAASVPAQWYWRVGDRFGGHGFDGRLFSSFDTIQSVQSPTGDLRSEILRRELIGDFQPHYRYGRTDQVEGSASSDIRWRISRAATSGGNIWAPTDIRNQIRAPLVEGFNGYHWSAAHLDRVPEMVSHIYPNSIQQEFPPGDFDNGYGSVKDGGYLGKADEGPAFFGWWGESFGSQRPSGSSIAPTAYFRSFHTGNESLEGSLASPNRQMVSPVIFGSIAAGQPWRTLLFRPDRAWHRPPSLAAHPGASDPPDYLLLDLFHMPVAEPYAISEPFSTAGKINLNSRLMPFGERANGGIRRETAMQALLRSIRLTAYSEGLVGAFAGNDRFNAMTRFPLNEEETLTAIRARFDAGGSGVYRTAAEICNVDLVPAGSTLNNLSTFWSDKRVTGNNSREAPYGLILPRITAKSNTFTVHYTVQTLRRSPDTPEDSWDEARDSIVGEQRGSFTIERFIDPADPEFNIEDYNFLTQAGNDDPPTLSRFYRFRVISNQQFRP